MKTPNNIYIIPLLTALASAVTSTTYTIGPWQTLKIGEWIFKAPVGSKIATSKSVIHLNFGTAGHSIRVLVSVLPIPPGQHVTLKRLSEEYRSQLPPEVKLIMQRREDRGNVGHVELFAIISQLGRVRTMRTDAFLGKSSVLEVLSSSGNGTFDKVVSSIIDSVKLTNSAPTHR
jgi:hypothetical protein